MYLWFDKFCTILLEFGFKRCISDFSVFFRSHQGGILIVYVDDIVITGSDVLGIQEAKLWLKSKLNIKDLGILRYFLGIEVLRD